MGADMKTDLLFQILGPVRVWHAGREIDVGARKQRAVLAALLFHLHRPVSVEEIVTFVWGDFPPPAAAAAVHTYVRGLRRALDPARPSRSRSGVVSSSSRGYQLRIDPQRVDCLRFRRLVSESRRHYGAGDFDTVVATLTAALRLWVGRPLADLGEQFAMHPLIVSVEQERLAVSVLTADAALAVGRVEDLIPLLVQVTDRAPLHEPLQARLIEAYRRNGRRADALATFDLVRRRLRDELGIGPGRELRAAFRRILDEDSRTASRLPVGAR
jgi:DNA-binding SARP family transcriptional activator